MSARSYNKILKYGFFGAVTTAIEFGSFVLLEPWIHIYVASTASFLIGLVTSFCFNKFIVFRNSKRVARAEALQFLALGLINSQLSSFVTLLLSFVMPSVVAKAITIGFIAAWNYIIMNKVIFRKEQT